MKMPPLSVFDKKLRAFVLDERETVHVCAWCFPLDKIFESFPHLRGRVAISHGICAEHQKQMTKQIVAQRI